MTTCWRHTGWNCPLNPTPPCLPSCWSRPRCVMLSSPAPNTCLSSFSTIGKAQTATTCCCEVTPWSSFKYPIWSSRTTSVCTWSPEGSFAPTCAVCCAHVAAPMSTQPTITTLLQSQWLHVATLTHAFRWEETAIQHSYLLLRTHGMFF